ncbi:hypothetical protein GOQ30_11770 [Flavobacterium sp. TP390]|uniref:Y_Y_Y domain-containing protein n=1 Tax=Flavobacterium profundi TaxID=1774945 RepID=A0A6I4IJM9_9FLAO|nr:histidine kinase [Flavobacterium profundi]MVO09838.1 hypothetical protein [Flavobacterium profundi]
MKTIFLYLLFIISTSILHAQTPICVQLTEKDGLPDYEIYDLIEDTKGFVWIAANKGLYRYDGKDFLHFNHPNKRGLSVFGLKLDKKGRVWCNTISGQIFYIEKEQMHLFADFQDNINGKLPEFIIDDEKLIVLTEEGIIQLDLKTRKKVVIKDTSIISSMYNAPFFYNDKLHLLHGSNLLSYQQKSFSKLKSFKTLLSSGNYKIIPLELSDNLLFSIYSNQIFFEYYNHNVWSRIPTPKEIEHLQINQLFYHNKEIWMATNKGVYVYELNLNAQFFLKRTLLIGENCTKVLRDKNLNFWISTLDNGIFVLPNLGIAKVNSLEHEIITDFEYFNSNTLLFGTIDGKIGWFDSENLKTTIFSLPSQAKVNKVVFDSYRNLIYISQENKGYVWNIQKNEIYNCPQLSLAKTLLVEQDALIFGTYNKCVKFNFNNFESYSVSKSILNTIPKNNPTLFIFKNATIRNKRTYTAAKNKENEYWISYVDNLFYYSNDSTFKKVKHKNKPVFAVDILTDNDAWVSTFENGLLLLNEDQVKKSYTTDEGLLSNYLGKIQNDSSFLWITTNQGLQKFNKKTNQFSNLLKSDGLETYDYYDMQVIGDYLFLSSRKGVYRVHKQNAFKKNITPDIFFTTVEVNGVNQKIKEKYDLDFEKSSIKISFNITGFQKEAFIDYEYRLTPLNKDWQKTDNGLNVLRYNSLSAGEYALEVRAKHKNGLPSQKKTISLIVHAPFWKKWWFYASLAVAFLLLIGLYNYYRNQKKTREQELTLEKTKVERELLFSQLENLRSQMNPHFIFNALNSIQEYIVTNEKDMASTYLVKFSRLIRMYLDHSRTQDVLLQNEIKALQLYLDLEKDRFEDTLEYDIQIQDNLISQNLYIPSLFIQPYVENAIKHGLLHKPSNRQLIIKFYIHDNLLFCEIFDNGVGRVEALKIKSVRPENHQSFATSANEKRVNLLNRMRQNKIKVFIEDLQDENGQACGTKVIIQIPIKKNESNNN